MIASEAETKKKETNLFRRVGHRRTAAIEPTLRFVELHRVVQTIRRVKRRRLLECARVVDHEVDDERFVGWPTNPLDHVLAGIAAGQGKAEVVENVRLEQYSHLMEYERSLAGNVAIAYDMLTVRQGR